MLFNLDLEFLWTFKEFVVFLKISLVLVLFVFNTFKKIFVNLKKKNI